MRRCCNCDERRPTVKWKKKWWCTECLNADEVPPELILYRCQLGEAVRQNEYGFNVAKFKKEIGRAMKRKGYKSPDWKGKER